MTEVESNRTRIDYKKDDKSRINTSHSEILNTDTSTLNNLALGDLTFLKNNLLDHYIHVSIFEVNDNSIFRSKSTCRQIPKTDL